MSKGLEETKCLIAYFENKIPLSRVNGIRKLQTIEKELKALEIIKEKANIDLLKELNDDEPYWLDIVCSTKLTKEEYDLLKEVLL